MGVLVIRKTSIFAQYSKAATVQSFSDLAAGWGFKAKVDHGGPAVGNRYMIIRYEDEAAYDKFYDGGGKEWIDKHAPEAREIKVEGVEPK